MAAAVASVGVRAQELAAVEMLGCLPAPALADLALHARYRRFAAGELIFCEGDGGESMFVVSRGWLKVVRPSVDQGLVLDRLGPGQTFGELAVLNATPRLASVIAVDESEVIEIRRPDLERVLDDHPAGSRRMIGVLARSLTLAKEEVARQNSLLEDTVRERTSELRETQFEVVRRLSQAAESRDVGTGAHIMRMSRLAHRLGLAEGMPREEAELLLHAAPLHDVGKIAIPDYILLKPGALTAQEWEIMKSHSEVGATLLSKSASPVVQLGELIALTHHERWDGSGYPHGRRAAEIPLASRVVAICDVFDALISERPYKRAWSFEDAMTVIGERSGRHFDPRLATLFLGLSDDIRTIVARTNADCEDGRHAPRDREAADAAGRG